MIPTFNTKLRVWRIKIGDNDVKLNTWRKGVYLSDKYGLEIKFRSKQKAEEFIEKYKIWLQKKDKSV